MRLGPFQLHRPLASGGMSEVWAAFHMRTGVFAAVKLIPPERVDHSSGVALEREIRTVASLDHPGIVWMYDQGTVSEAVEAATDGRVAAGSPYLVMEYASYTLRELLPISEWGELRTVLVALLDALAHAHARGVIHRDLKPGNVLMCGPDDLRPGLKLTDFGIAHALDAIDPVTGARKVVGTPRYMAPEQIDGDWRSLGPGTDLYSLAGLVHRCVTGHGPFRSSGSRLLMDHLRTPPPPLELPPGFAAELAEWTAWLLSKDPARRPSSAAEALAALPAGPHLPLGPAAGTDDQPTQPLVAVPVATLGPRRGPRRPARSPLPGLTVLPVPIDWRPPRAGGHAQLADVGRAMLGLRPPPLAGREEERDRLWTALRQATNRREATAVAVTAHAGLGRTRLLDWFSERASELACAAVLPVRCRPRHTLPDALRRQLQRLFLTSELDERARRQRVRDVHARLGIAQGALVDLALDPDPDPEVVLGATRQLVEQLAQRGTVLVTCDDVHHDAASLAFARELLAIDGPVVVVLSAQEEALADDPQLRVGLDRVARARLVLEPLRGERWTELVNSILPLAPGLAAAIQERTQGNPRFAVQLLTEWARNDVLLPGPDGFDAPADLALPESLHSLWGARLDELLDGLPRTAAHALELAATLGVEVEVQDLRALLPQDEPTWQALFTRLGLARLCEPTGSGFAFAHPALREVILARAEQGGRARALHARVASLLQGRTDATSVGRRGRHRAAAGDLDGAYVDLMEAASRARSGLGITPALVACAEAERLVPRDDERRARALCLAARILCTASNYTAAQTAADEAARLATAHGWRGALGEAELQRGAAAFHRAEADAATAAFERALTLLEPDAHSARGAALSHLAWLAATRHRSSGRVDALFARSAAAYRRDPAPDAQAAAWLVLADQATFAGDMAGAERALRGAWALAVEPARVLLRATVLERLAFVAYRRGDHDSAAGHVEAALTHAGALSAGRMARARVLRAAIALAAGDPATAHERFRRCARPDSLPDSPLERCMVYAGLLASTEPAADAAHAESWLRHLESGMRGRGLKHPLLTDLLTGARRNASTDAHATRLGTLLRERAGAP